VKVRSHRWLIAISGVLLVAVAATLYALPTIARHLAVARLHVLTKRPVSIDRVEVRLLGGRFTVHGLRVAEPDGTTPFAECELLEDRALPEPRAWTSDDIQIEAHNVSTLRDDGTVVASSVTAGALNLVEIEQFRLYPIHLKARVTVKGLDLALARLYLPPDSPVVLDRGRVSSVLEVTADAGKSSPR